MEINPNTENFVLEGSFVINHKDKPTYAVTVNRESVVCSASPSSSRRGTLPAGSSSNSAIESLITKTISFDDAVGCACIKGKKIADTAAYLVIYAYPRRKKHVSKSCRRRETLTLKFDHLPTYEENQREALRWKDIIMQLISRETIDLSTVPSRRMMLVLVNPFSGPGKALHIFQQQVVPIFAESDLHYQLFITEYAGHAREMVKQINLDDWYGIIIVSGDGLIFEVVNGLMERHDWDKAIKMPLGTIPGGSGNALACAICYDAGEPYLEKHILHSTFIISKCNIVPMDLVAVDTCTGKRLYSFLSIGWGMMSDVDIESEKYRNMGNARFAVMAVMKIASMKRYRGRLSFLPVDDSVSSGNSSSEDAKNPNKKETRDTGLDETGQGDAGCQATVSAGASGDNVHISTPLLVPLNEPVPPNWVTIENDFILVGAIYQSHLAKDNLMAQDAKLNDGIIHLVFVRSDITRLRLAHIFTNLETGLRTDDPSLEVIKVRAFRLEPLTPKGLMTVDGEVVDYGPIQAQVLPSMARVMSIRDRNGKNTNSDRTLLSSL